MCRILFWVLLLGLLLQACAHSPQPSAYPVNWKAPVTSAADNCVVPVGLFSNQGDSSDPVFPAPSLASILFDDKLAGFPVESIRIVQSPDRGQLIFKGVLAGVELKQHKTIKIHGNGCETDWKGDTNTGEVGATLRTQALLYTGGVLMPLSQKYKFNLQLLQDGALLVHLEVRESMLGALLIPLTFSDKYWLRYDRLDAATLPPPEPGNPL